MSTFLPPVSVCFFPLHQHHEIGMFLCVYSMWHLVCFNKPPFPVHEQEPMSTTHTQAQRNTSARKHSTKCMRVNKAHETISLSVKISLVFLSFRVFSYCIVPSPTLYLLAIWWAFTISFPHQFEQHTSGIHFSFSSSFFALVLQLSSCFEFNRAVTANELTLETFTKTVFYSVQTSESALFAAVRCVVQAVKSTIKNYSDAKDKKSQPEFNFSNQCDTNSNDQLKVEVKLAKLE